MHSTTLALCLMLGLVCPAVSQTTSPTHASELKKLDYFTGNWSAEATIPSGPWGAGGKLTSSGTGEWMKGGFFVVGNSDYVMPTELGGAKSDLRIFGYDGDKNVYTEERFGSSGLHEIMEGRVNGDTWTWTGNTKYNGMSFESRLTITMNSATSYTDKYEVSVDGGASWMPFWVGKGIKK
jgi:hypothetical protein